MKLILFLVAALPMAVAVFGTQVLWGGILLGIIVSGFALANEHGGPANEHGGPFLGKITEQRTEQRD